MVELQRDYTALASVAKATSGKKCWDGENGDTENVNFQDSQVLGAGSRSLR